ncbi:uncharacterized protein LOC116947417 [Petromyzon marinus]|uniref:uncharacterized protein LOC116947417 n=1 Tax=Petromyzon marinus TaxID=7757 RepID=UPI003F7271CD
MGAYHGKKGQERKGREASGRRGAFTADLLTLQISAFHNGGAAGPRLTPRRLFRKEISKMPIIAEEDENKAELRSEHQPCDVSASLSTLQEEEEEPDARGNSCQAGRVSGELGDREPPDQRPPGWADVPGVTLGSGEHQEGEAEGRGDTEPMEVDTMLSEPDYGDETPGLIKPKKLINPVKESRRHQDLHRELLMKNKRGQGLQPKPELLRVLDQRKWEQRVGRQRHHLHHDEEPEPNGALQQELLKRFQRLEQLDRDLEFPGPGEEQPGGGSGGATIPEFIRVRDNLRRTRIVTMETEQGTA